MADLVVLCLRSEVRDSSPSGGGPVSVFLIRLLDLVVGSSSHIHIRGKHCFAWQALKSGVRKDHINLNTASKKFLELMLRSV